MSAKNDVHHMNEDSKQDDPGFWAGIAQHRASDPTRSVWVNASAGTGKTKVLIERVLRLLLPRLDGTPGAQPNRILCLTYTKAASAEMIERLLSRVSSWAVMKDDDLNQALRAVLGIDPTDHHRMCARRLFTELVDGPDQVRIMTIHAFCQSVLSRFPLEAGISPHFTLIEGAEFDDLLNQAQKNAMRDMGSHPDLSGVMARLATLLSDHRLSQVMRDILSERRQLTVSLSTYQGTERDRVLREMLGLENNDTLDSWAQSIIDLPVDFIHDLILLDQGLRDGTKVEKSISDRIYRWTIRTPYERLDSFDDLVRAFFGVNGDRLGDGGKQGRRKADDQLRMLYVLCGDRVETLVKKRRMIDLFEANISLFAFVDHMMSWYDRLKRSRGVLDFDDLIRMTSALLGTQNSQLQSSQTPSWVMYKLDGGIDHILVDEAQDTNPEQWQIIAALAQSFDPEDQTRTRSLFVVGDQKQSIYRFQGADPDTFEKMLSHFGESHSGTPIHLDRIPMNTSFRSTSAVLTVVDQVFNDESRLRDLRLSEPILHVVHRQGQSGRVEVWPLVPLVKDTEKREPWVLPIDIKQSVNGPDILARRIARRIRSWMDQKTILPSRQRPIEPRDIMILVRKREPYLSALRAALRAEGIPVASADRQEILESIAVEDLISLAQFSLLPSDDLALACVLKSPLFGGTDDDLIKIAPRRSGSLWDALQSDRSYLPWVLYLKTLIDRVDHISPYQFLSDVLNCPCPARESGSGRAAFLAKMSGDHLDSIDHLLGLALAASQNGDSMVTFVHGLIRDNPEIRQLGSVADNVVRLMTVHGSKGLESPIVILPDTIKSSRDGRSGSMFWPDDTGAPLPLWVPLASDRPDDIPGVMERVGDADRAEEQRLLYVALTRAQDWLIVAGAERSQPSDQSWYDVVSEGMSRCALLPGYRIEDTADGPVHIFEHDQLAIPDRQSLIFSQKGKVGAGVEDSSEENDQSMIDLVRRPLRDEPAPARPFRADSAHQGLDIKSPLDRDMDQTRFARGLAVHKLLEILPQIPRGSWEVTARAYVVARADILSEANQERVVSDVLGVLNHRDYGDLFGPGSRAEVRVTGILPDGRLMAGQIDRLLIRPDIIHILDYKTGMAVPQTIDDVESGYINQMGIYRDLLRSIYPNHQIQCTLLYTTGPVMIDVCDILSLK